MKINLNAGHTLTSGAVGLIKESTETRNIAREVKRMLEALGHTVYECTIDGGMTASKALAEIVKMCNTNDADLSVSIHLNSCVNDLKGNGKTTGTEVFAYSEESAAYPYAEKVSNAIEELGYRNRGAKIKNFYFLGKTKSPAILVECCFVDDKDDVELYNATSMAKAIVKGLVGVEFKEKVVVEEVVAEITKEELGPIEIKTGLYRVIICDQVGAYGVKANAVAMQKKLKAAGFDAIITQA